MNRSSKSIVGFGRLKKTKKNLSSSRKRTRRLFLKGEALRMGEAIQLYVYDLSKGMALVLGEQLTGKRIDGIW